MVFVRCTLPAVLVLASVCGVSPAEAQTPVESNVPTRAATDVHLSHDVEPAPRALVIAPVELELPHFSIPTVHAFSVMTVMRVSEAYLWPEPFAETRRSIIADHYRQAFTQAPKWDSSKRVFEWDGDPWYINALGHQLFGSELYLRARSCDNSPWVALGFATLTSATWEYLFESSGVRPSALDLWYTPVSGMLLGEGRYWGSRLAGRIDNAAVRILLKSLLDPFGELERAFGARC